MCVADGGYTIIDYYEGETFAHCSLKSKPEWLEGSKLVESGEKSEMEQFFGGN